MEAQSLIITIAFHNLELEQNVISITLGLQFKIANAIGLFLPEHTRQKG